MSLPQKIVVSVESRKGGSGKSIASLILGQKLINEGYQVLIIDADITGTSITQSVESHIYPAPKADDSQMISYKKGGYHVVRTKNISHTSLRSDDEKNEAYFADFFKSFNRYLQSHTTPAFSIGSNPRNASPNKDHRCDEWDQIYYILKNQVNVLGSNYVTSFFSDGDLGKSEPQISPSVLFNDLHSRWLLQFIKRICTDFTLCFLNSYEETEPLKIAIIIDNSPGNAGVSPMMREWLTDMGPEIGKFLMVTSIDVRDLKPSLSDLDKIHELFKKKWSTAKYYKKLDPDSNTEPGSSGSQHSIDETFFRKLHECAHYNENRNKRQTKDNDKKFSSKESSIYQSPTNLSYDIFLHRTPQKYLEIDFAKDKQESQKSYQAVIINNVPADLFAGGLLNSHDVKTKKELETFFETGLIKDVLGAYKNKERDDGREIKDATQDADKTQLENMRKYFIVYHEPLLAYAHLKSNEFKPEMAQKNSNEPWKEYYYQQIYGAKMLCALLQKDFDEALNHFTSDVFLNRASSKDYYMKDVSAKDYDTLEVLNRTMNRLRAILYPFAHRGLHQIFPSITDLGNAIQNVIQVASKDEGFVMLQSDRDDNVAPPGSHMTPFHMLMQRISFYLGAEVSGRPIFWYVLNRRDNIYMSPIRYPENEVHQSVQYVFETIGTFCERSQMWDSQIRKKCMKLLLPWVYHNFLIYENKKGNEDFINSEKIHSWAKGEDVYWNGDGGYLKGRVNKGTNLVSMYTDIYDRFENLVSDTAFILSAIGDGIKGNDDAGTKISKLTGYFGQEKDNHTVALILKERTNECLEFFFTETQYDLVGADVLTRLDTVIDGILEQWKIREQEFAFPTAGS